MPSRSPLPIQVLLFICFQISHFPCVVSADLIGRVNGQDGQLHQQHPILPIANAINNGSHNPLNQDFAAFVHEILAHFHVPGVSVAIVHKNETFAEGYGYSILPDTKARPESMYFTGSTTKSFTAAVLSMIMEEHREATAVAAVGDVDAHLSGITLNDNMASLGMNGNFSAFEMFGGFGLSKPLTWQTLIVDIPGMREDFVLQDTYITAHATLEDLGSHRSGVPGHDLAFGNFNGPSTYPINSTTPHPAARATTRSLRHLPLSRPFRASFQYNNMMYGVLQHCAETLTNRTPLGTLMVRLLWHPLGMTSTLFTTASAKLTSEKHVREKGTGELARGYLWDPLSQRYMPVPHYEAFEIAGAGSIISTVLDYAKYLRMMLQSSPPLSASAYTDLRRARFAASDYDATHPERNGRATYTLGWISIPYRGVEIFTHNGGLPGFGALMVYVPHLDFAVAMMGNTAGTSNYAQNALFYKLLDDLLEVPEGKRVDVVKSADEKMKSDEEGIEMARERLFPSATLPDPRTPLGAGRGGSLEEYVGVYTHPGYRSYQFSIAEPAERMPRSSSKSHILRVNATDRTFPYALDLEHVNGEYFIAWLIGPRGYASREADMSNQEDSIEFGPGVTGIDNVAQAMRAQFLVGADGKVKRLGMQLEGQLLPDDDDDDKGMIWFDTE